MNIETKRQRIHDHLKAGHSITQVESLLDFGYLNLKDFIHVLRKRHGYNYITRTWLHSKGAKYARYSITDLKQEIKF